MKQGYVYILTNKPRGTLYTGVTSGLIQRIYTHKEGVLAGFTKKHQLHHLVYFEIFEDITEAIAREKRLKRWRRDWKIQLIEAINPTWDDLYPTLF